MDWIAAISLITTTWVTISSILRLGASDVPMLDPTTCNTPACYASAEYLQASADFTTDPCDDFYQYACGGWEQNHLKRSGAISTMHDRFIRNYEETLEFLKQSDTESEPTCVHSIRKFFASCLDTDAIDRKGIEPLADALERVHLTRNPPILSTNPTFDLIHTTVEMQKSLGIEMFYSIGIQKRNPHNGTDSCISILRPSILESPLPTVMAPSISDVESTPHDYWTMKHNYFLLAFSLLCDKSRDGFCDRRNLAMAENGNLEKYIRTLNEIKRRPTFGENDNLVFYPLGKLQNFTNELAHKMKTAPLNWTRNLEAAFLEPSIHLNDNMQVLIDQTYIKDILVFIYQFSAANHELGAWWTVVDSLAEYSISPLRTTKRKILDTFVRYETREMWCEKVVNRLYGPVVSYRYNADPSHNETKFKVTEMVQNIREVFIDSITLSLWMDATTKRRAVDKIRSMDALISFPDSRTIGQELDVYYRNCDISDNFLESTLLKIMQDSLFTLHLQNARDADLKTRKKFFFFFAPVTVNALYLLKYNSMITFAGILGFPLFGNGGLEALNYASIGSAIGHEMAHSLDNSGRQFSLHGELEDWWDPQTLKKYNELEDCLIDAYNKLKVNGSNTLGENIADNIGFRQALLAYRSYVSQNDCELKLPHFKNWTHEQLFTMSYANMWCEKKSAPSNSTDHDMYSRNSARVLGVLANSREFSRIWKCAAGKRMYTNETKCLVW